MVTTGLSEAALKSQLKRLKFLRGFDESKEELLRVMWNNSHSDEHAGRIITRIVDTRRPGESGYISCPTPAELVDYCNEVPANPSGLKEADKHCKICGGTGWKIIQRGGISGADRCPCRRVA